MSTAVVHRYLGNTISKNARSFYDLLPARLFKLASMLPRFVVIKYNKLSLIKKKHKNKRELKTETRNDPLTTHTCTQTNTYEQWSRRPIRRGMPIGDDRQAPERRWHNKEESKRWNHIHAQTQDHTEQTAERCHRRTTTNQHMIYPDTSNRCEVCLRYFTKSLHATVFMQMVYSTVVRGYS